MSLMLSLAPPRSMLSLCQLMLLGLACLWPCQLPILEQVQAMDPCMEDDWAAGEATITCIPQ